MKRRRYQLFACLGLVAYVAAGSTAVLFHDPAAHGCRMCPLPDRYGHNGTSACEHPAAGEEPASEGSHDRSPADDCAACRWLAQAPAPVAQDVLAPSWELSLPVAPVDYLAPEPVAPVRWHSRAPPADR